VWINFGECSCSRRHSLGGKVSCPKFPSRSLFVFFKYSQCDQVTEDHMGAVCSRHPWIRNTHELTSMSSRTVSRSSCQESFRLLWILFISGSQYSATGLYFEPAESSVHTYTLLTSDACWYCFSIYVHISRIFPFFQV